VEFVTSSVMSLANDRAVAVTLAFLLRGIEIAREDVLWSTSESSGRIAAPSSLRTSGGASYRAASAVATA
jgi:hypothetical protein